MTYGNFFDIAREQTYPTPYQNSTLLPLLLMSLATQKHSPDTTTHIRREYDYIIVGGGTAGSVVASRLSEIPCVSVLLLEAGDPPPLLTDIPAIARSFIMTDIDWDFLTEPQKHTGAVLINRQATWPSGKTLGGSSVHNGMLAVRGNRLDYDIWEQLGATGWSWKDVLPYFMKLEDSVEPDIAINGFHGIGGPVTIGRTPYSPALQKAVLEAGHFLGYPFSDANTGIQYGLNDYQSTMRRGQRCSAAKAYLVPSENRTNLDIVSGAFVTKPWLMLNSRVEGRRPKGRPRVRWIDGVKSSVSDRGIYRLPRGKEINYGSKGVEKILFNDKTATGVQFDFKGRRYEIRANKEVVMAAGTVNTAQLLILSGIGPKETLQHFQIPEIADLPVGQNFQDHCAVGVNFVMNAPIPMFSQKLENPRNIKLYAKRKVGPLASNEGTASFGFFPNNRWDDPAGLPNHQIYFLEGDTLVPRTQLNIIPSVYQQIYGPYENRTFLICMSSILHPKSIGYVSIRSTDPYAPPVIEPNYFEHPADVYDVVSGMKACLRIAETPSMQSLGIKPFETVMPGCEDYVNSEDDYLECIARSIVQTLSHQVGTAKMGDPRDPTTVVDPELRVKGIKDLRIVDASVMPKVPSGNTNLPTFMLAEKASDIIKDGIRCH